MALTGREQVIKIMVCVNLAFATGETVFETDEDFADCMYYLATKYSLEKFREEQEK